MMKHGETGDGKCFVGEFWNVTLELVRSVKYILFGYYIRNSWVIDVHLGDLPTSVKQMFHRSSLYKYLIVHDVSPCFPMCSCVRESEPLPRSSKLTFSEPRARVILDSEQLPKLG